MKALRLGSLLVLLAAAAWAAEPAYQTGELLEVRSFAGGEGECFMLAVRLDDVVYLGRQCASFSQHAFAPHEFLENAPVQMRVEKDKLCLRRPNGKEVKAKIVRRVRWDGKGKSPFDAQAQGAVPVPGMVPQ